MQDHVRCAVQIEPELVLLDGQLRGVAHITDIVEAYGHPDYSTVSRAMRDGEATVIQDKHMCHTAPAGDMVYATDSCGRVSAFDRLNLCDKFFG